MYFIFIFEAKTKKVKVKIKQNFENYFQLLVQIYLIISNFVSPIKPEFPLSISQKELLNVIYTKDIQKLYKLLYKIICLKIIYFFIKN